MSWSARFSEPIAVPQGRKLVTLGDAWAYVQELEDDVRSTAIWQTAARNLLCAVEEGNGSWGECARTTIELAVANPHLMDDKPGLPGCFARTGPVPATRVPK